MGDHKRILSVLFFVFSLFFICFSYLQISQNFLFGIDFFSYYYGALFSKMGLNREVFDFTHGISYAFQGPFLEAFQKEFFPSSTYATRWVYLPLLLTPFKILTLHNFTQAKLLWSLFNLSLLPFLAFLFSTLNHKKLTFFNFSFFLLLFSLFGPISKNILLGNITLVTFTSFVTAIWLFQKKQTALASGFLSLSLLFKFYPALTLLYFWKKNKEIFWGTLFCSTLLILLSFLFYGTEANIHFFESLLLKLRSSKGVSSYNNQSLTGFLLHLFTEKSVFNWTEEELPQWILIIKSFFTLSILSILLFKLKRISFKKDYSLHRDDQFFLAFLICVSLLIRSFSWYHYYIWILFPMSFYFKNLMSKNSLNFLFILFPGIIFFQENLGDKLNNEWMYRALLTTPFMALMVLTFRLVFSKKNTL